MKKRIRIISLIICLLLVLGALPVYGRAFDQDQSLITEIFPVEAIKRQAIPTPHTDIPVHEEIIEEGEGGAVPAFQDGIVEEEVQFLPDIRYRRLQSKIRAIMDCAGSSDLMRLWKPGFCKMVTERTICLKCMRPMRLVITAAIPGMDLTGALLMVETESNYRYI